VKQIFEPALLVIMLSLASPAIAQAQHSNTSKVGGNSVADLEQLRPMAEKGDPDAQYQLAESYRIGFPVERDVAAVMVWYRKDANSNGGRSDGASGGDNSNSDNGRSGDSGGNPGGGNTGGGNTGGGNTGGVNTGGVNTGDRNTSGENTSAGNTSAGNTGDRDQGSSGQGSSGQGNSGRDH
jgi:hypothetical protein